MSLSQFLTSCVSILIRSEVGQQRLQNKSRLGECGLSREEPLCQSEHNSITLFQSKDMLPPADQSTHYNPQTPLQWYRQFKQTVCKILCSSWVCIIMWETYELVYIFNFLLYFLSPNSEVRGLIAQNLLRTIIDSLQTTAERFAKIT